ncbi:MAG TPA: hypothetical protein VGC89_02980, partial [Pyrinomonadaceae bacterium]
FDDLTRMEAWRATATRARRPFARLAQAFRAINARRRQPPEDEAPAVESERVEEEEKRELSAGD